MWLKSTSYLFLLLCATTDAVEQDVINVAQEKFQATFTNMGIQSFGPSPIEGIYQMKTQTGIIYYYPKQQLLIFGEIYTKDGISLTRQYIEQSNHILIAQLPLDSALVLGNPKAKRSYIEITNPDCQYCRSFARWVAKQNNNDIKRYVFFYTTKPVSIQKSVHILCHPKDYNKVFSGEAILLKTCPEGEETFKKHSDAMLKLAPSGTPSFIVAGKPFVGFDEPTFTSFYKEKNDE